LAKQNKSADEIIEEIRINYIFHKRRYDDWRATPGAVLIDTDYSEHASMAYKIILDWAGVEYDD
jgi:hypothetical protein